MHRIVVTGLLVLVALLALPVAEGAKPIREVFGPGPPDVFPAGLGCSFDVGRVIDPDSSFGIDTFFSDGRFLRIAHGDVAFTNLVTGTSYFQKSRFQETQVYDEAANDVASETAGRFYSNLWPGDQGPFGEVGEYGAMYIFEGTASSTYDIDTDRVTSFEYTGRVTDLCAILAG
jgi:hypothetical protein